jgi:aspartyl-tRNA synthetase
MVQLVVDPSRAPEAHALAEQVRPEFVLTLTGEVVARSPETVNPNLPTGDVEVKVGALEILNRAKTPPFEIETAEQVDVDETLRLKYRYLDLRRAPMLANLELRNAATQAARTYLNANRFIEVETPDLTRSSPEGARDFLVPSRLQPHHFYALPQSPQMFKQILMVAGMDRYYQFARCFRDEDLRADRQPEHTQIDLETSFLSVPEIRELLEGLMTAIFEGVGETPPETPLPRLSYDEAMLRYGSDKPDLRYGLEIVDLTDAFAASGFQVFHGAVDAGGCVRAICARGAAALSRAQIDALTEVAKANGAKGMAYVYVEEGRVLRALGFDEARIQSAFGFMMEALEYGAPPHGGIGLGLEDGDLCLLVAGPDRISSPSLDRVRQEVAHVMDLIPGGVDRFVWIIDFPLFERDPATGALSSVNHPFTAPHPEDVALLETAPERARALAYDVVLNGTELGGGSLRIADPRLQRRVFGLLGIADDVAEQRFGFLLEGLREGAPPHGGFAFGMDRIAMLLGGAESLRDVIAFPKTTAQRALFEDAPSPVSAEDLRELHVAVIHDD